MNVGRIFAWRPKLDHFEVHRNHPPTGREDLLFAGQSRQTDWCVFFLLRCSQKEEVLLPPACLCHSLRCTSESGGHRVRLLPPLRPSAITPRPSVRRIRFERPSDVDCFRRPKSVHPDATLLIAIAIALCCCCRCCSDKAGDGSAARNTHREQRTPRKRQNMSFITNGPATCWRFQ